MSKILLTAIFKDDSEAPIAERMLDSFMPHMDGLVVGLTGISGKFDLLKKLITKHKGTYVVTSPETHPQIYSKVENKWIFSNFSAARNVVFEEADKLKGYDWYCWADCDDILIGGEHLNDIADMAQKQKMDTVFFTYWYSVKVKKDGTFDDKCVEIDQIRERLIKPHTFKWVSRLHEIAVIKDEAYKPRFTDWKYDSKKENNIVWVHLTNKDRADTNFLRNIQILEIQIEEEKWKDPRTISNLAKTYFDLNTLEYDKKAIPMFEKYLSMSGWEEDRALNLEYLGKIYSRMGNHKMALEYFHMAVQEFPNRHMNYLNLAKEYFEMDRFENCEFWLNVALKMPPPEARTVIGNPIEIMFMSASISYNLAIKKMDIDKALYWLKIRNDVGQLEDDGMTKTLEDAKYFNQIGLSILNLAKYLKTNGHTDKLRKLLEVIPPEYGKEPFVSQIANEVVEPRKWGPKSVVYYASFGSTHFEEWDYRSLEKGIGGSETAVIELAERWQKLGYEVTVFCEPIGGDEFISPGGVIYRPWWQMNWSDSFNTLILWRSPHLLDLPIKAKELFMDLHDVASNLDYTPERVKKLDGVFVKSLYHRKFIPAVPDSKVHVISNGIVL